MPGYRGRGIGERLLERHLAELARLGYERVTLSAQKKNSAVRLYERLGFEVVIIKKVDYIMEKQLVG
ncbi:MAG: GNAT family N-acetyltransferase [Deltaproteobacteria bacterium]|nr:GNAT family N-acetyltransferase [Deltaproteobacteria bacterium]